MTRRGCEGQVKKGVNKFVLLCYFRYTVTKRRVAYVRYVSPGGHRGHRVKDAYYEARGRHKELRTRRIVGHLSNSDDHGVEVE